MKVGSRRTIYCIYSAVACAQRPKYQSCLVEVAKARPPLAHNSKYRNYNIISLYIVLVAYRVCCIEFSLVDGNHSPDVFSYSFKVVDSGHVTGKLSSFGQKANDGLGSRRVKLHSEMRPRSFGQVLAQALAGCCRGVSAGVSTSLLRGRCCLAAVGIEVAHHSPPLKTPASS